MVYCRSYLIKIDFSYLLISYFVQKQEMFKEMAWNIIRKYYDEHDLTRLQIDSYNSFIVDWLPSIVENKTITIHISKTHTLVLFFRNVHVQPPTITENNTSRKFYPSEARDRDFTYESKVLGDIDIIVVNNSTKELVETRIVKYAELFTIPVMVNSMVCNLRTNANINNEDIYNNGGYFVIKGKERVIIAQERINYNHVYVYKQKNKYKYMSEVRSVKEGADYSVLLQAKIRNDDKIVFNIPYIKSEIPVCILFIAMGVDVSFIRTQCKHFPELYSFLRTHIDKYEHISTEECIEYMSRYTASKIDESNKIRYTIHILENEIVPHLQINVSNETRVVYLLNMLSKMILTYKNKRIEDDRDHICNKRVEMVGDLMGNLVNGLFQRGCKMVQQFHEKRNDISSVHDINVCNMMSRMNITHRLYQCFTTGNWGMPKSNYIRQGVSQILSRLSYIGMLSHLRRVVVPIGKESKNTLVRQVHSSNYGFIDVIETPEGHNVGIVRNLSLMTRTSTSIDSIYVIDMVYRLFEPYNIEYVITKQHYKIYVNGVWVGSIHYEYKDVFIHRFIYLREICIIPLSVSIGIDDDDCEIIICSDTGRILRPVLTRNGVEHINECSTMLWQDMVNQHYIFYIDGNEAQSSFIAMYPSDFTDQHHYCEIHPALMLGICSNTTPFPEHSQAPRNVYVAAMMKQAIGMYSYAYRLRFDTFANVLNYPTKKLVTTQIADICKCDEMPSGQEVIVAIMCYTGFNQEDSILMNQSAIDRGLFQSVLYKTCSTSEQKKGTHDSHVIQVPIESIRNPNYNYSKLCSNGIVSEGTYVEKNDVLVGKVYYNKDQAISENSLVCKANNEGIVGRVYTTINASGYKLVKVTTYKICIPEIGDKFCQVSAQKGTLGMVLRQEDMPFTRDGIVPDIVVNPNCMPSRMTINMLLETLTGKAMCYTGEIHDASAFDHNGEELVDKIGEFLTKEGFDSLGTEVMCNGFTGLPLKSRIFIGPAYYQRLKHMVDNKIHARSYGNVQLLTRQPCAGRSKEGGLKYGEINFRSQWCSKKTPLVCAIAA